MPQIGPLEILVVFIVALLVFGPKEIPRVARQAARAWRDVQRFQATVRREIDDVLRDVDEDEADEEREKAGRPPTLPPKQAELSAGGAPGPDSSAEEPSDASPPADPTP